MIFERLKERTKSKKKGTKMEALQFWLQIIIECTDG